MQGITISLDPVRHAGLTPANRGGDYIKRRPIRGPRPNLINFLANCVSFGADFYDNDIPNMSNVAPSRCRSHLAPLNTRFRSRGEPGGQGRGCFDGGSRGEFINTVYRDVLLDLTNIKRPDVEPQRRGHQCHFLRRSYLAGDIFGRFFIPLAAPSRHLLNVG